MLLLLTLMLVSYEAGALADWGQKVGVARWRKLRLCCMTAVTFQRQYAKV